MEIPGSDNLRIDKNKAIRDKGKVAGGSVQKTEVSGSASSQPAQGADQSAISAKAKETQLASSIAKSAADVRFEKVTAIKEKIDSDQYDVDSRELADKILRDIIAESEFLG